MKKTNLYFKHDVLEVKIHNEREGMLVRCIQDKIERIKEYYGDNVFQDRTYRICTRLTEEVNTLFSALYFLYCIKNPFNISMDDII